MFFGLHCSDKINKDQRLANGHRKELVADVQKLEKNHERASCTSPKLEKPARKDGGAAQRAQGHRTSSASLMRPVARFERPRVRGNCWAQYY